VTARAAVAGDAGESIGLWRKALRAFVTDGDVDPQAREEIEEAKRG
jgi:hypothetical protein